MESDAEPLYRGIVGIDIERFSRPEWTDPFRARLRNRIYEFVDRALEHAGIGLNLVSRKDTGDGLWLVVSAQISVARLVHPFATNLAARIVEDNRPRPAAERMRTRIVIHSGELLKDPHGETGSSLNDASRLLDASVVRAILAANPEATSIIAVSSTVYDRIVRHGYNGIDPTQWQQVSFQTKEVTGSAWVHMSDLAVQPRLPDEPTTAQRSGPAVRHEVRDPFGQRGRGIVVRRTLAGLALIVLATLVVAIPTALAKNHGGNSPPPAAANSSPAATGPPATSPPPVVTSPSPLPVADRTDCFTTKVTGISPDRVSQILIPQTGSGATQEFGNRATDRASLQGEYWVRLVTAAYRKVLGAVHLRYDPNSDQFTVDDVIDGQCGPTSFGLPTTVPNGQSVSFGVDAIYYRIVMAIGRVGANYLVEVTAGTT